MNERKFTDEEVIKALECHAKRNCGDCPMCGKGCADKLIEVALDLITRQKAEIERLRNTVKTDFITVTEKLKLSQSEIGNIRAEALTEYVTELEKRLIAGGLGIAFVRTQMHELLKEMTEENNGQKP